MKVLLTTLDIDIFHAQHGGPFQLTIYLEQMPNFSPEKSELCHRQADEPLMANMYPKNADQSKKGSHFNGLASQFV